MFYDSMLFDKIIEIGFSSGFREKYFSFVSLMSIILDFTLAIKVLYNASQKENSHEAVFLIF